MTGPRSVWTDAALALLTVAIVLGAGFRSGWSRVKSDFPNYYTAAAAWRRGLPLRNYYDWTWFQREMNYTGTERQLGAYTPQTPLALVPFLPLSGLSPQKAKRVWLVTSLAALAGAVVLLARTAGLSYRWLFLILLACCGSLHSNFLLGQYYIFLVFLLSLSASLLFRGRQATAGAILGLVFALKLYSGPFILFFAAARLWKAAAAMAATAALLAAVSIFMYGWDANLFYVTSVLPSVVTGMVIDPYNPGQGSLVALLRRMFVAEPELNPHPWLAAPAVFVFLRSVFVLGVLAATASVLLRSREITRSRFAWLVVALLLLAPVNAGYVFALLIVPAALLLPGGTVPARVLLLLGLAVLGAPLPPAVQPWFPRVLVLFVLFIWSGWEDFRSLNPRTAALAALSIAAVSLLSAQLNVNRPELSAQRIVLPGYALAAMSPAVTSNGVIYQAFGKDRYILRTQAAEYEFAGHAFHPAASPLGGPVVFELVAEGHSRILSLDVHDRSTREIVGARWDPREPCISKDGRHVAFVSHDSLYVADGSQIRDLRTAGAAPAFTPDGSQLLFTRAGQIFSLALASGRVRPLASGAGYRKHPALSPDGAMLAYAEARAGGSDIWLQQFPAGSKARLTSSGCNNDSPAWEADSLHLLFTSDCGRGLGLPGLYRAPVPQRSRSALEFLPFSIKSLSPSPRATGGTLPDNGLIMRGFPIPTPFSPVSANREPPAELQNIGLLGGVSRLALRPSSPAP